MTTTSPFEVRIYRGRKRFRQAWRWRAVATNGRVIAVGGEAYTNVDDLEATVFMLFAKYDELTVIHE